MSGCSRFVLGKILGNFLGLGTKDVRVYPYPGNTRPVPTGVCRVRVWVGSGTGTTSTGTGVASCSRKEHKFSWPATAVNTV